MAGNINTKTRKEFKPYKGKSSTILELASSLYGTCKTACAFTYVDIPAPLNPVAPESDANVTENIEIETSVSLPKPFDSVMKRVTLRVYPICHSIVQNRSLLWKKPQMINTNATCGPTIELDV